MSQGQQPVQRCPVRSGHIDDLHAAGRSRDEGDRVLPDAERRGHRRQGGRRGLAVHRARADPDHKRPVMLAAHAGTGRPRPNPDSDSHQASLLAL